MNENVKEVKFNNRIIIILLVAILAVCCTLLVTVVFGDGNDGNATDSKTAHDFKPLVFSEKDLAVIDTKSNKLIQLGMTKERVEDALGEPLGETSGVFDAYEIDGLRIKIRDGKVVGLAQTNNSTNKIRFTTSRNATLDTPYNEITRIYGELRDSKESFIDYRLVLRDGNYSLNDSPTEEVEKSEWVNNYYISFSFDEGKVKSFFIGDYQFIRTMS